MDKRYGKHLKKCKHGKLRTEPCLECEIIALQAEVSRLTERYKELTCSIWQMPLEEFEDGKHKKTCREADRQAMAVVQLQDEVAQLLAAVEAELIVLESQLANFDQYGIDATLARAFKVGLRKRINALRDAINKAKGE